jgi:hypothetical protein
MIEIIKILLDKGLTISTDNGANLRKTRKNYIYQESCGGCFEGKYNVVIQRFINDNDIKL